MKYRKKPVIIDAIQFTKNNIEEIKWFTNNKAFNFLISDTTSCIIPTLEGSHLATEGDYIIKGIKGEFYPCKPDIFNLTYENINDINEDSNISEIEDIINSFVELIKKESTKDGPFIRVTDFRTIDKCKNKFIEGLKNNE